MTKIEMVDINRALTSVSYVNNDDLNTIKTYKGKLLEGGPI